MDLNQALKEKSALIWRKIQENSDRSAFVVFLLLLILMLGLYGKESSSPEPEYINPKSGKIESHIPNPEYEKTVEYLNIKPNLDSDETLRSIRDFNIFDYKYVRDRNELQKAADKKYQNAEKLFADGKNDEAEKLLQEILLAWPSHVRSRELFNKIEEMKKTPTPTPTPKRVRRGTGIPGMPGGAGPGANF